jgi:dihydrofolate synthase/folylpolyglutamate synthase
MKSTELMSLFRPGSDQVHNTPLFTPYLSLNPVYADLLSALGRPQENLPPVIHVAGTNGKGSTCAYLRALTEAAGKKAHVYTSPHLVSYHERIRVGGSLIEEEAFTALLSEVATKGEPEKIPVFEATTAVALTAFARNPADVAILEVGMGGRLDATNIIEHPVATLITRLSMDHRDHLGDSIEKIAREKAGIMRKGVPCFAGYQASADAIAALEAAASEIGCPLYLGGRDWFAEKTDGGFRFRDGARDWLLPLPALLGDHQILNAGLALAASRFLPFEVAPENAKCAMGAVEWPARLQHLTSGSLARLLPPDSDLWLDGGHNDSAGEVLAAQLKHWKDEKPDQPIHLICGMINTKKTDEFLSPLLPLAASFTAVEIPNEHLSLMPEALVSTAKNLGFAKAQSAPSVAAALCALPAGARILICGSLYLAGAVLAQNQS